MATGRLIQIGWQRGDPREALLTREWLVTNALGGYACGTIGGTNTRRFHGYLIAALRAPLGRTMMFNHLEEVLAGPGEWPLSDALERFALEHGTPVWRFEKDGIRIEKRVVMPHLQNTTYTVYRLLDGPGGLTLRLRPSLHFRPHEGLLTEAVSNQWRVTKQQDGRALEIRDSRDFPPLRLLLFGPDARFEDDARILGRVLYPIEKSRGYEYEGPLRSPGVIHLALQRGVDCGIVASVESWDVVEALSFAEAEAAENERRAKLLSLAGAGDDFGGTLVLAADQFLIHPHTRSADEARARAAGDEPRTVIAGYHWFTDWGRDTMISLDGLTLATGRHREAGNILRTFASYIRDGLIPNLFPEGEHGGLYHTADATMWFFHAVWRYANATGDVATVRNLVPKLLDIVEHHIRGTHFNIRVDPADGLLVQGAEGYQLTWMDAKVDGWVVTPRRGKAVEINALWYNALRILEALLREHGGSDGDVSRVGGYAEAARRSFNERFWFEEGQHLYDVVDAEGGGDDPSLRPNQIFAISTDFPVLDESRWRAVVDAVERELVTPVGLRSLGPRERDYKKTYDGDLRSRDAAYHQGTVWAWLIGPFVDAWLKVHPGETARARSFLDGFRSEVAGSCIGTISEIFDAEPPHTPRGCVAQAWSVAEVLRVYRKLSGVRRD